MCIPPWAATWSIIASMTFWLQGAEPLFFLDYLALGKMDPHIVEQLVDGMSRACRKANCALIGGETAEMPGFYGEGEYDLAGFIVAQSKRRS